MIQKQWIIQPSSSNRSNFCMPFFLGRKLHTRKLHTTQANQFCTQSISRFFLPLILHASMAWLQGMPWHTGHTLWLRHCVQKYGYLSSKRAERALYRGFRPDFFQYFSFLPRLQPSMKREKIKRAVMVNGNRQNIFSAREAVWFLHVGNFLRRAVRGQLFGHVTVGQSGQWTDRDQNCIAMIN